MKINVVFEPLNKVGGTIIDKKSKVSYSEVNVKN